MCRSIRQLPFLSRRLALLGVAAWTASFSALPAAALDVEPYAFYGYRDGSLSFPTGIACITIVGVDCPVAASTEDGDHGAWGLGVALRVKGPWWVDLRWSEQGTEGRYLDGLGDVIETIPPTPFDISSFHAGVLYRFFDDKRWSPFVTAFGGVSYLDSDLGTPERRRIDVDGLSLGLGGGVLVDLNDRVGLRLEVRGFRTDLPSEFDGDLEQVEGSAGVRLRF